MYMIIRWILVLVLAAFGFALALGGVELLAEGGSPYYILAGAIILAVAYGLSIKRQWSLWTYGVFLSVTMLWALWESGLDIWALLPRVGLLTVIGLLLLLPGVRRRLEGGSAWLTRAQRAAATALILFPIGSLLGTVLFGQHFGSDPRLNEPGNSEQLMSVVANAANADWSSYGGTPAGTRYSELRSITPANVSRLRMAWTYKFNDPDPGTLEVSPLKVGHSLYACNSSNVVVSLNAETGREQWRFDPQVDDSGLMLKICRGVAYYKLPAAIGDCAERIYTNTMDARLIALDAHTGRRCRSFGRNGEISLLDGMGDVPKGYYFPTSAPLLARGRLVVGSTVLDNQYFGEPSGVVRAFDALTGELAWAYDVGDPELSSAPPPGESYTHSTPNSWAPKAYDDELGLVYVPTGSPTPDYYGAQRRSFDDEAGNSVLALDIETGRRRWLFQAVHHDLWDWDLASPPVLFDKRSDQGVIRALAQPTKRGETFMLDRVTGRPLGKVVEKPVSVVGAAPTERVSPTQPFPTEMPSLAGAPLTEKMMWGLTPLDQLWCRIKFRQARYEGQFTPPGLTPSIMYPGYLGGMNWGGVSIDGGRGIMIAVTNYLANYVQLLTREEVDATGARPFGQQVAADLDAAKAIAVQANLPYAARTSSFLSPLAVPCQQPPWSRLSAIDLRSKRVLWSRPLGTGKDMGPLGIRSHVPFTMGVPALGASLVTASNLTFVGASSDRTFRAFETSTGRLLWETSVTASANSGPMTYQMANGRQFVVVAAGGNRILGAKNGGDLVAFALPPD